MVSPMQHHANQPQEDDDQEAMQAVEELVAEFGIRGVVSACLKSSIGEDLGRFGNDTALKVAQTIICEIAFSSDPQLDAEIMALGTGYILNQGDNVTRIAMKHGLTKQAVSKRVIRFCDDNRLPPSVYMRSLKDRETYRLTNQPKSQQ